MNTGQMMLTMGAMIMLSILILRVNNNQLRSQDTMQNSKYGLLAISVASSVIEDANKKAFDEATVNNSVTSTASLTTVANLGPESGETYDTFDDIDDYNNYTKTDSSMPSAVFNIKCTVCYVSASTPDITSATPTWNKKITVYVTSKSIRDTVKLSQVFSYWSYF
jgi:hypothetical protein